MMSIDRAKRIIQCYGASPEAWPEHDRQAIQHLLLDSKSLADFQQQAFDLDKFIGLTSFLATVNNEILDQQCASRILSQLPEQQRKTDALATRFFRKAKEYPILLVASFVLFVFGLSGSHVSYQEKTFESLSIAEYIAIYIDEEYIPASTDDEELEVLAFLEPQFLDDF